MKKLIYVGGGSVLLLLALLCGAFFANTLVASAHSASAPTQKQAKHKDEADKPLREFTRNYSDKIIDQVAPQLHLSDSQLTQKLQSGEHLAKIAKEQKVSTSSLKTIIINAVDNVVAQELSAKKIDQQRADLLKDRVHNHPFIVAHVLHHKFTKK